MSPHGEHAEHGGHGEHAIEYGATDTPKGSSSYFKDPISKSRPFMPHFTEQNSLFVKGPRKRLDIVSALIALFVPWLLFSAIFAVLTFKMHYGQTTVCYVLATMLFFMGVVVPAVLAANAMKRKATDATYQPSWYIFLFGTCLLAYASGAIAGEENYFWWMHEYYNLRHLTTYENIDTNVYLGQQIMDAGTITFVNDTRPDITRSMGFKNNDIYCVAPIVTNSSSTPQSYDFWAVGKNCCSGTSADFHCPGFNDRFANGAVRLMWDMERPYYRLAVQQAEATYKMTATHPLFFEWVHNTEEATNNYAQTGYTNYIMGICAFLVLQIFLVVCASLVFSKMVHFPGLPGASGHGHGGHGHGGHGH